MLPRHASTTPLPRRRHVFEYHGKRFFRCLSKLANWTRSNKIKKAVSYNIDKPPAKRRRVPYIRPVEVDSAETSGTASSSGEEMSAFFEHSPKSTPHAIVHFTEQVMMGGTHHFHDTADNEAIHRECVKISGARARIYNDVNVSSLGMLRYTMDSDWYQQIFDVTLKSPTCSVQADSSQAEHLTKIRLSNLITDQTDGLDLLRGRRRHNTPELVWDMVLCAGVPVSVRELVSLFADNLNYRMDKAPELLQCSWTLGWHVKSLSSKGTTRNYWGGGVTPATTSNYLRGDWLETKITDLYNGVETSRLVRVICGVSVAHLKQCDGLFISDAVFETAENKKKDRVNFLLVRYAERHPHSRARRGPDHRPVCPGVLQDTHCLWQWSQRQFGYRRACLQAPWWDDNKEYFGSTEGSRLLRKNKEIRAWYDLIQIRDIKCYANVQLDPDREDSFLHSVMWW